MTRPFNTLSATEVKEKKTAHLGLVFRYPQTKILKLVNQILYSSSPAQFLVPTKKLENRFRPNQD